MLQLQAQQAAAYPIEEVCHSIVAPAWHGLLMTQQGYKEIVSAKQGGHVWGRTRISAGDLKVGKHIILPDLMIKQAPVCISAGVLTGQQARQVSQPEARAGIHSKREMSHVTSAVLLTTASFKSWKMVNLLSWPPLAFRAFRNGWQPLSSPRARLRQSAARAEKCFFKRQHCLAGCCCQLGQNGRGGLA